MSDVNVLPVSSREGVGKGAARAARRQGQVPAVVYGAGKPPVSVNIKQNELIKALKRGKFLASLLDLELDGGEKIRVLPKEVQRDVVLDLPVHVDFLRLSDRTMITLFVALEIENQDNAPGLKKGGALTVAAHEVRVRCRAGAIPDHLTLDIDGAEIGATFTTDDVKLPSGVVLADTALSQVLASIAAPRGIGGGDEVEGVESAEGEAAEGGEEGGEE